VALFGKKKPTGDASTSPAASLGSGLLLRSDQTVEQSLQHLEDAVRTFRTPQYRQMALVNPAGYRWLGSAPVPTYAVAFSDDDSHPVLAVFWASDTGMQSALVPLGTGDERLRGMKVVTAWKSCDRTLAEVGTLPAGQVISIPLLPNRYLEELLASAGHAQSQHNVELLHGQVAQMFLLKAHQFVSSSEGTRAADRFVAANRGQPAQRVLDNICSWNATVGPYVQDLPYRVRGILLEANESSSPGTIWDEMRPL
jgi:hypothetical protein